MAYYMCRNSSKLSYITGLVEEICGANGRKVIICCDWPSTAWLVEVLMLILGFNVLSIRAKYKQKKREEAVSTFNDKDCPIPVLVTSVKVSATAINLQKDCADVIFIDVSSNAQSIQQAPPDGYSRYTSKRVTAEEIEAFKNGLDKDVDQDIDEIRGHLINESCAEDYRLMFGQRSRREDWQNGPDLTEKGEFPVE